MRPKELPDVSSIEGFLSEEEAVGLFSLAASTPNGVLEIGTYCGRSTVAMAAARKCIGGSPVYAVDHGNGSLEHQGHIPHGGTWPKAIANFSNFEVDAYVVPVMLESLRARVLLDHMHWGLVFIDGGHERVNVMTDALIWIPKIVTGGRIAFHDYSPSGVQNVVPCVKALENLLCLKHICQIGSIAVFEVNSDLLKSL